MRFGGEFLELAVPLAAVVLVESAGGEELDPALLRHHTVAAVCGSVAQEREGDLLLAAKGGDLAVEIGEAAVEGVPDGGTEFLGRFQHGVDLAQRHAGGAQFADPRETGLVDLGVEAMPGGCTVVGAQETETIVVEQGGAGETELAGELSDGFHGGEDEKLKKG
jgi:hypothetical protein